MNRIKLFIMALIFATTASADTYPYLSFQQNDGIAVSIGAESLSMTFSDSGTKLYASNGTESLTLNTADISKMFFTKDPATGISEVAETNSIELRVYTTSGIYVGTFSNRREIDESLEPGIYLMTKNGKTTKIAVR